MFGNTQGSDVSQSRRGPARALLAGGFTTAVVAGSIFATAGNSNAASGWAGVAQCESGGNPTTNTGNSYYGLYQFDRQTWQSLGYRGTADQYSAAVQTQAAERLYAQRGDGPWPICGQGLSGSAGSSGSSSASRSHTRHALTPRVSVSRSSTRHALTPSHVASQHIRSTSTSSNDSTSGRSYTHRSYRSGVLGAWLIAEKRSDVRAIQQKLDGKGYGLAVDGQFGPKTEGAVKHFQAKAGISVDGLYGSRTKAALFG
jgi:hypothetical protein